MKLPFAIKIETGELVEIGAVISGRGCKCLCPSCGQGLIARKGEKHVWHFAHDSRSEYVPKDVCDVSFYSCCRRYILGMASSNAFKTLQTPDLHVYMHSPRSSRPLQKQTIPGKKLTDVTIRPGQAFDLEVEIGSHFIDIHLAYPLRQPPDAPVSGQRGLLVVNVDYMASGYNQRTPSTSLLRELAIELLAYNTEDKHWAYHPKEAPIRQQLMQAESTKKTNVKPSMAHTHPIPKVEIIDFTESDTGSYFCQKCNHQWKSARDELKFCKKCGTDKYTKFWPRPTIKS